MMKLSAKRYTLLVICQLVLLVIDLLINVCSIPARKYNGISLILFIAQSSCIILSLSALLLTVFSTYAFQAGLADLLYEKFHLNLIVFMLYFILTSALHIWFLVVQWNTSVLIWSTELLILFIIQKTLTPIYYYYYKRVSLRISDPRFYEDLWNQDQNEEINH